MSSGRFDISALLHLLTVQYLSVPPTTDQKNPIFHFMNEHITYFCSSISVLGYWVFYKNLKIFFTRAVLMTPINILEIKVDGMD